MVFVQYKKSEKNNFILSFPCDTLVNNVLAALVQMNNIRIYLDRLIWSIEELANKGVLKPPQLQGISYDDYEKHKQQFSNLTPEMLQYATKPVAQHPYKYVPDKNNQRHGIIFMQEQKKILLDAIQFAKKTMEPKKEVINKDEILQAIENLRMAVMMAYPAYIGLPQWEPSLLLLQEKIQLAILQYQNFQVFDMSALIWWTGKQLDKTKKLHQYTGKNEKTKIIVKVQKQGGQQPPRQPPVDSQTYKQMVKYYYKKVDETKQFEKKSVQNHYEKIESESMKQKLHFGGEQIRFKPF